MTEQEKRDLCISWINNMDEFGLEEVIKENNLLNHD